jgi:hypothetical protein
MLEGLSPAARQARAASAAPEKGGSARPSGLQTLSSCLRASTKKGHLFMKHPALLALGCALLALGLATAPLPSTAQTAAAPTPVPIPHPDFSSMNFLLGSWSCTQPLRGKMRPETDVYSMGMDNMWMVDQSTAPPFDQYRTVAQNGMGYISYDPTVKQWVSTGVDTALNRHPAGKAIRSRGRARALTVRPSSTSSRRPAIPKRPTTAPAPIRRGRFRR